MSVILVVDDQPSNREFLSTLLGYVGHRVVEAADGAQGLAVAAREDPDLIISDVLMPTMDGYEFVRRLRAEPGLAAKPVVFYTAHYLEKEALTLAKKCGVSQVLAKPSELAKVIEVVSSALGIPPSNVPLPQGVASEHLELITTRLSRTAEDLARTNAKLEALVDAGQRLAVELDPQKLVEECAVVARHIVGVRQCSVGILDKPALGWLHIATSGFSEESAAAIRAGWKADSSDPHWDFCPEDTLCIPLCTSSRFLGWLCLATKLDGGPFGDDDRKLGQTVAAQLAVAYENVQLHERARIHANELERTVAELQASNAENIALLQEVHHRVNNNLAVISSLLRLQAEASNDGQVQSALLNSQLRIDAMSQIHRQLYGGGDLGQVDFAEYANRLADHLLVAYGVDCNRIALRVDVEQLKLPVDKAIPLGLILGELMTNAIKYAFPDDRRGTIQITGRGGDQVEVAVADDGVGMGDRAQQPERKSVGLQIVGILCRQLKATLEQSGGARPGAMFRVSFAGTSAKSPGRGMQAQCR